MATSKNSRGANKKTAAPKDVPATNEEKVEETTQSPEVTEPAEPEVKEEPKAPVEPAKEEVKAAPVKKTTEGQSISQQYLTQVLDEYVVEMRPGRGMPEEVGARQQTLLATVLVNNVFGAAKEDFGPGMKTLLDTIKENRDGAFGEKYVYRFVASMRVSTERRALFEDLLTIALTTSDQGVQAAKKQIDIKKFIDRIADERIIENLQSYYKVDQ